MKIALRLQRRLKSARADAVLLLTREARDLIALCSQGPAFSAAFDLGDRFLILLDTNNYSLQATPVTRLRSIIPNLFVPADADLLPSLTDHEAADLVRHRGLVVLPDGIRAFLPNSPLRPADLVRLLPLTRERWQPLSSPTPLASRIHGILLDRPDPPIEVILDSSGSGVGGESPDAESPGPGSRLLGEASYHAGKSLMGLGKLLGLKGLANLGANMVAGSLKSVPSLSESLLGKQGSALQALLREFREGNLEKALRRAIPLDPGGSSSGTRPASGFQLPFNDLIYSLGNILTSGSNRGGGYWFTGDDLYNELLKEYRKSAEDAARRGDYRRAALIYAKLLKDYHMAAGMLSRGGHHHDAALLYLNKLNDPKSAARCFESGGEYDRALELYRKHNQHVLAGELLRRMGEEEQAIAEFHLAARLLADASNHHAAGELMRAHVSVGLAIPYYEEGWQRRSDLNAESCALQLLDAYSQTKKVPRLLGLVGEAELHFHQYGNRDWVDHDSATFFNRLAKIADHPNLRDRRDELVDRSLINLAGIIRRRAKEVEHPGFVVSKIFGQQETWTPSQVSDATFAYKSAVKAHRAKGVKSNPRVPTVNLGEGEVTSVAGAGLSGAIVVVLNQRTVVRFRPTTHELTAVATFDRDIYGVTIDDSGDNIALLSWDGDYNLTLFGAEGPRPKYVFRAAYSQLCPRIVRDRIAISRDEELLVLDLGLHVLGSYPYAGGQFFLAESAEFDGVALFSVRDRILVRATRDGWTAIEPWSLSFPDDDKFSYMADGKGISRCHVKGHVTWNDSTGFANISSNHYLAGCLIKPREVAAVWSERAEFLICGQGSFKTKASVPVKCPNAIACFPSPATGELLIVSRDAILTRVPYPT